MVNIITGKEYISSSTGFRVVVDQFDGENVIYTLVHNCAGCYSSASDFEAHYQPTTTPVQSAKP